MEPEGVKGPCVSRRKTAAQSFMLSRCTSRAGRHCSSARFDCQLSGKAREDSDRTVVIAILYWHLPLWRNCERCNNSILHPLCSLRQVQARPRVGSGYEAIFLPACHEHSAHLAGSEIALRLL